MKGYLRSNQRIFQLAPKVTTIGKEGCDLVIQSSSVDQQHALLEFREQDDCFVLQDLSSAHGSYVNDCRVENACVRLANGDVLRFGNSRGLYELVVEHQQTYEAIYPPVLRQSAWVQPLTVIPDQLPSATYHGSVGLLPQLKTFNISTTQTYGATSPSGTPPLPRPPPSMRSRPLSAGARKQMSERTPSITVQKTGAGWLNGTSGLQRSSSSTDLMALQETELKQMRMQEDMRRLSTYEFECRRKDELIEQLYAEVNNLQRRYEHPEHTRPSSCTHDAEFTSKLQSLEREVSAKRDEVNSLRNKINTMRQEERLTYRADDRGENDRLKGELERALHDKGSAIEDVARLQQQLLNMDRGSEELSILRAQFAVKEEEIRFLKSRIEQLNDLNLQEEIKAKDVQLKDWEQKYNADMEQLNRDHSLHLDGLKNNLTGTVQEREREQEIANVLRQELKQVQHLLHEHERSSNSEKEQHSRISNMLGYFRGQMKELVFGVSDDTEPSDDELLSGVRKLVDGRVKKKLKVQGLKAILSENESIFGDSELLKSHFADTVSSLVNNGFHSRELKLELAAAQSKTFQFGLASDLHQVFIQLLQAQSDWQAEIESALRDSGVNIEDSNDNLPEHIRNIHTRLCETKETIDELRTRLDDNDDLHKSNIEAALEDLGSKLRENFDDEKLTMKKENEASVQATIDEIRGLEESNSREAIALERSRVVELEENLRRLQMSLQEKQDNDEEKEEARRTAFQTIESYRMKENDMRQRIEELESGVSLAEERLSVELDRQSSLSEREMMECREQIKQYAVTICMLEEQLNDAATRNKEQHAEIHHLKSNIHDLHNRMVHPPAGPPQQQRILVQSHGGQDVAMMQSTLSQMNRDNGEYKNQLMEQHDVILSLRRDLAGATARLSDVTGELSEAQKQQVEQYRATIHQQSVELTGQQQQMAKLSQIIDRQAEEVAAARVEAGKHKSAAGKYKMRLNEKEVKIKQTEEHIVQVKNDLAIQLEPVNEEKRISSELSVLGAQCKGERHEQVIARQREALGELRARMKVMEQGDVPFLSKDDALQQVHILRQQLSDLRSMSSGHSSSFSSGDAVQMSSMRELEEAFELSENQYLSLLRALASSLELQQIGGMRSLAHCSKDERLHVTSEREQACEQIAGHVRTLRDRISRKDELLGGYEKDLATLRHVENLTELTSNQATSVMSDLRSKSDENQCLRESLRKTKERLDQEKRLNAAIKQKKTYHLENENVARNGWPKHQCIQEDIHSHSKKRVQSDRLKKKNYDTSDTRLMTSDDFRARQSDLDSQRSSNRRTLVGSVRSLMAE